MRKRRRKACATVGRFEELESRTLLSVTLTADEQFMLELINRARAEPDAEAARFGIDLNEGLAPGTISSDPKQPLAPNDLLRDAVLGHLDDMIANDFFAHEGSDGSTFTERIEAAGYTNWTTASENLAWRGSTGAIDVTASVELLHELLFVDAGIDDRGHRINMLNGSLREAGSGVQTGQFQPSDTLYNAVVLGQDFATRPGSAFLTGVAYSDGVTDDDFYTVGEGLGSITVTAVNSAGDVFSTATGASGGYSLALPGDVYTVTATGSGLGGTVVVASVSIGSSNVKLDFTPDQVAGGAGAPDTAGLFDPVASRFFLQDENAAGVADLMFRFGPQGTGWTALAGDFNGDGIDTVGLFDPVGGTFYLQNTHSGGAADMAFRFGPSGSGWTPVVGDWNGDGMDTVGLFDATTSTFFLTNSNAAGAADRAVRYGPAGAGWEPIVGDWNADGSDTLGLFDLVASAFFLKNSNTPGAADVVFRFGPSDSGWTPLAGDWDGNVADSVGLFNPGSSTFFLSNANAPGPADEVFRFGPTGSGWQPIMGNWGLSSSSAVGTGSSVASTDMAETTGIAGAFADRSEVVPVWLGEWPQENETHSSLYAASPTERRLAESGRAPAPLSRYAVTEPSLGFAAAQAEEIDTPEASRNSTEGASPDVDSWARAVDQLFSDGGNELEGLDGGIHGWEWT